MHFQSTKSKINLYNHPIIGFRYPHRIAATLKYHAQKMAKCFTMEWLRLDLISHRTALTLPRLSEISEKNWSTKAKPFLHPIYDTTPC